MCSWLFSLVLLRIHFLGTIAQVVQRHAQNADQNGEVANPLRGSFPDTDRPRNMRIFRQAAIGLGIGYIVQHVDDAGPIDARRIVDARFLNSIILAELLGAGLRQILHVVFGSKVQAAGGTRLDARRLEPLTYAIDAQRAFEHLLGRGIELRNIERASANAITAANAILLLEI